MANIKPLKRDYKAVKETYNSFNTLYRNLVYYSCDGDARFLMDFDKINFEILSDTEVKELIIFTLSYGLKTHENEIKKYIMNQYNKNSSSILKSLIDHDIDHLKPALSDRNFQDVFALIFMGDAQKVSRVLTKLKNRVGKMKSDVLPPNEETALVESLIRSIIEGKNIAPDGTVIEDQ